MVAAAESPNLSTAIIVAPSRAKMLHAALPIPLPAPGVKYTINEHFYCSYVKRDFYPK